MHPVHALVLDAVSVLFIVGDYLSATDAVVLVNLPEDALSVSGSSHTVIIQYTFQDCLIIFLQGKEKLDQMAVVTP